MISKIFLDMKEATEHARQQGKDRLDPLEVVDREAKFLSLLGEGDLVHPRATAPPGTEDRCKQSAARNLLDRLHTYQQGFLCLLEDLRVDFDNKLAERDVHMDKLQQKISGCFRSRTGADAFCRIRGYLSTLRVQSRGMLCTRKVPSLAILSFLHFSRPRQLRLRYVICTRYFTT